MSAHTQIALRNRLISLMPNLAATYQNYNFISELNRLRKDGWVTPLPSLIKRCMIKTEAKKIAATSLVETGTYLGDTPWFFRKELPQIISIEVEPRLAALATARFKRWPNVAIITGDSAQVLAEVMRELQGATVFWLDGHYSSGVTGRGQSDCPIMGELTTIFSNCTQPYTVMIDDARLFGVDPAYPTMAGVEAFMRDRRPDYGFRLENDVLLFSPPGNKNLGGLKNDRFLG